MKLKSALLISSISFLLSACGGSSENEKPPKVTLDNTPNAFSFAAADNVTPNEWVESEVITISGIDTETPISIQNGEYRIFNREFTNQAGTVSNEYAVTVRAKADYSETVTATLTVGGVSGDFSIKGAAVDTKPDPFSFTPLANAQPNEWVESEALKVSGINTEVPVSIENGEYSIDYGEFTNQAGIISNGQNIIIRAKANFSETVISTLSIGGVKGEFKVTTLAEDQNPDLFSFESVDYAPLNKWIESNRITITGVTSASVTIENGEYSIDGDSFTNKSGVIKRNQSIKIRMKSANELATASVATIKIGNLKSDFIVNTKPKHQADMFFLGYKGQEGLEPRVFRSDSQEVMLLADLNDSTENADSLKWNYSAFELDDTLMLSYDNYFWRYSGANDSFEKTFEIDNVDANVLATLETSIFYKHNGLYIKKENAEQSKYLRPADWTYWQEYEQEREYITSYIGTIGTSALFKSQDKNSLENNFYFSYDSNGKELFEHENLNVKQIIIFDGYFVFSSYSHWSSGDSQIQVLNPQTGVIEHLATFASSEIEQLTVSESGSLYATVTKNNVTELAKLSNIDESFVSVYEQAQSFELIYADTSQLIVMMPSASNQDQQALVQINLLNENTATELLSLHEDSIVKVQKHKDKLYILGDNFGFYSVDKSTNEAQRINSTEQQVTDFIIFNDEVYFVDRFALNRKLESGYVVIHNFKDELKSNLENIDLKHVANNLIVTVKNEIETYIYNYFLYVLNTSNDSLKNVTNDQFLVNGNISNAALAKTRLSKNEGVLLFRNKYLDEKKEANHLRTHEGRELIRLDSLGVESIYQHGREFDIDWILSNDNELTSLISKDAMYYITIDKDNGVDLPIYRIWQTSGNEDGSQLIYEIKTQLIAAQDDDASNTPVIIFKKQRVTFEFSSKSLFVVLNKYEDEPSINSELWSIDLKTGEAHKLESSSDKMSIELWSDHTSNVAYYKLNKSLKKTDGTKENTVPVLALHAQKYPSYVTSYSDGILSFVAEEKTSDSKIEFFKITGNKVEVEAINACGDFTYLNDVNIAAVNTNLSVISCHFSKDEYESTKELKLIILDAEQESSHSLGLVSWPYTGTNIEAIIEDEYVYFILKKIKTDFEEHSLMSLSLNTKELTTLIEAKPFQLLKFVKSNNLNHDEIYVQSSRDEFEEYGFRLDLLNQYSTDVWSINKQTGNIQKLWHGAHIVGDILHTYH